MNSPPASPASGTYFRVLVRQLSRANEDAFSAFCFDHGAVGVSEKLSFAQPDVTFDPTVVETPEFEADVFFEKRPPEDFLARLSGDFPGASPDLLEEPNKNWLEEWKKGFAPFLFVEPFWIVPTWRERPQEAREAIWVDPGMAFGTGTHETTRLAAALLVDEVKRRGAAAASVLDVGTGTGVLAIVARKLGCARVVAIDNDPEARRVARENLEQNRLANEIWIPETQLGGLDERFDVVVANIIDGVLALLRGDLLRALAPGGTLILSGILTEREKPFVDAFVPESGLRVGTRLELGEWAALQLN